MNFVVFDASTGMVLRYGICEARDLHLQAHNPGEAVIPAQLTFAQSKGATVNIKSKVLTPGTMPT